MVFDVARAALAVGLEKLVGHGYLFFQSSRGLHVRTGRIMAGCKK